MESNDHGTGSKKMNEKIYKVKQLRKQVNDLLTK